jgi:hypothetical protein
MHSRNTRMTNPHAMAKRLVVARWVVRTIFDIHAGRDLERCAVAC